MGYDNWFSGQLPNGVVKLTNADVNWRGPTPYLYRPGGGPPRLGTSVWNSATGGHVDARTGEQIGAVAQDRGSVIQKALAAMAGGGGYGGGPAFYGDSYGGVQGAAQRARERADAFLLGQQKLAEEAAYRADLFTDRADARDFQGEQAGLSRNAFSSEADLTRKYNVSENALDRYLPGYTAKGRKAGGYTGDGSPDDVAGWVHKKEYVIPADVTARLGPANLDKVVKRVRGYEEGGLVDDLVMPEVEPRNQGDGRGRWVPYLERKARNWQTGAPVIELAGWEGIAADGRITARIRTDDPRAAIAIKDHQSNLKQGRTIWDPNTLSFKPGSPATTFKRQLEPAVSTQATFEEADKAGRTKLAALEAEMQEGQATGRFVKNKETKRIEAAPGPVPTTLPDGTPIPPDMMAGRLLRNKAQNAAALKRNELEYVGTSRALEDIQAKLAEAEAQVNDVTRAYSKHGLTYRRPAPTLDGRVGPGFIYKGVQPIDEVKATPVRPVAPVAAPVRDLSPAVKAFLSQRNAELRAINAARELEGDPESNINLRGIRGFR